MSRLDFVVEELVTANRVLANEGIVDSFGHVSARHPDNPQRYLLSRARAPERIERDDIVGVTGKKLKPLLHMCANFGHEVPIWDSHDKFGDTSLLVTDMEMGRDLGRLLGSRPSALMRGHGATVVGRSVRHAVFISVYLELGAKLQMQSMAMGEIKFLTAGEVDKIVSRVTDYTLNRAWENWARRAGREMQAAG
jgi:ribulose-5-phosphate 4-epimerase/fuculose-1-phosphate aldolase